jgi:hypothetical protein
MIVKELQGKKPKMTDESLLTPTPGGSTAAIRGIPPPRRGKGTRDGMGNTMNNGTGNGKHHSQHHYLYMCVHVS